MTSKARHDLTLRSIQREIAAGRDVLRASPDFKRLVQSLGARIEAADAVPAGPAAERFD